MAEPNGANDPQTDRPLKEEDWDMSETFMRANWIGAPEFFNLNFACQAIVAAFGYSCYLVGSSMERRDFRDVDVRCLLSDEEYDRIFPPTFAGEQRIRNQNLNASWCLLNSAISCWLSERTNLKIDFQFQRQSDANEEHRGKRNALGMFLEPHR